MKQGYLTMLSVGHYGRFCNALYQVAGILGIAKANNLEPVFPPLINHCHRDQFGSTEDVDLYKHFVHALPSIPEGIEWQPEMPIQWGYNNVRLAAGNWNLSGHFQSPKYFDNCRDQIQHYFRMKDEPPQNDRVAIHVRLGDYDNGYHPRLDARYYGEAIARFPSDTKFLVFSDDINGAVNALAPHLNTSFDFAGGNYLEDFALMKRCKHFIIGNSSYSAMAAVLGEHPDKRVIAPRPWFGEKYAQITGEDIYDSGWEVINWSERAAA